MNFAYKAVAVIALSTLSTFAMADKSGFYMDFGLGIASQNCGGCGTDIDNGFGGKIAGGYRFNDYVAAEVGFAGGQGSWSGTGDFDVEESTNTFYGAVVGILPFASDFEVFGRLGLGSSKSVTTIEDTEFKSDAKVGIVFGLGLGYTPPGTKMTFRAEFNHLSSDESDVAFGETMGPDSLNLFGVGFVLGF